MQCVFISFDDQFNFNNTRSENQVATTRDYATSSLFWFYITGGLNHQTAHHLFPGENYTYMHDIVYYAHKFANDCVGSGVGGFGGGGGGGGGRGRWKIIAIIITVQGMKTRKIVINRI
jgi:hypothetical protein